MFTIKVNIDAFEATVGQWQKDANFAEAEIMRDVITQAVRLGADHAVQLHRFRNQTHKLEDSIKGYMVGDTEGVIEATAPYASDVEEGTPEHDIDPVKATVLHWIDDDGEEHFARHVDHPGTKARPFIGPASRQAGRWATDQIRTQLTARLRRIVVGLGY